jgi:hypothetical protein
LSRISGPAQRDSLPVPEIVMAQVIEFYVPRNFRKPLRSDSRLQPGRVLEFCSLTNKKAELNPCIVWKLGRSWKGNEVWHFSTL